MTAAKLLEGVEILIGDVRAGRKSEGDAVRALLDLLMLYTVLTTRSHMREDKAIAA